MTGEVRDRVTGRWAEYGIGAGAAGADSTTAAGAKMSRFARSGRDRT